MNDEFEKNEPINDRDDAGFSYEEDALDDGQMDIQEAEESASDGVVYTDEQMREYAQEEYLKLMNSELPGDEREFLQQFDSNHPLTGFRTTSTYFILRGILVPVAGLLAFAAISIFGSKIVPSVTGAILSQLIAMVLSIAVIYLFVRNDDVVAILGLKSHTFLQFLWHLAIMTVALLGVSMILSYIVGDETFMSDGDSPKSMIEPYLETPMTLLMFLLMTIVVAPFVEEFVFRGSMLGYFKRSAIGATGSVIITSALWSLLHIQYNFVGVAAVFAMGLALGYTRVKTDSLRLTITLHSLKNLVAVLTMLYFPEYL